MPAPRGLVQQVDQYLHRTELMPQRKALLVAVSGGADSVALLRLLVEINRSDFWKWKLMVGHVDHGMRGEASREDARFVEALAGELKLPYMGKTLALGTGTSEAEAREARFAALAEMVRGRRCAGVVLAHHADDQAETMLMRMMRGCGLAGLSGMAGEVEIAGMYVFRPLLPVRRAALREYLREIGQEWREDVTNDSGDFLRNRVRMELMPVVERIWPAGVEALGRLGELAEEVQDFVGEHFEAMANTMPAWSKPRAMIIHREALRKEHPVLISELLRLMVEGSGGSREVADFERIREAVRLIQGWEGAKRIQMGRGVEILLEGDGVRIEGIGKSKGEKTAGPKGKGRRKHS